MPVRGPGGGTSFEGMSHEQMLAWLDRADAGQVQAAAGRLTAAAKAIREIAEELKVRPQWVAWKGEGANAFRTWSADLANSTLRLGNFSEDAAKWLTEASGAIAQAQASIPRETGGGGRASNSSDTATASTPEAAALAAHEERVREEAAAQMRKLTQTYAWSATQLNALERPKLPPPPKAITPDPTQRIDDDYAATERPVSATPVASTPGSAATSTAHRAGAVSSTGVPSEPPGAQRVLAPSSDLPREPLSPTHVGIDSATTQLQRPQTSAEAMSNGPVLDPVKREVPSSFGTNPPVVGYGRIGPSVLDPGRAVPGSTGSGKAALGPSGPHQRTPVSGPVGPGQSSATGRAPLSSSQASASGAARPPVGGGHGIVGGRPVPPAAGRSTGAIPRGTVVGGENTTGRSPAAQTGGPVNTAGRPASHLGQMGSRRVPAPQGGVVGGRPLPPTGGGSSPSRQQGRTRGPGTPPARGGVGTSRGGGQGMTDDAPRRGSQGVVGVRQSPPASPTNAGNSGARAERAADDERTRHEARRRDLPPAVD